MFDYQPIIDKYYPADTPLRDIYMRHCTSVADKAIEISHHCNLDLPDWQVRAAAMLHDIGIVMTDAPGIHCHGNAPYLAHGMIGADLLRRENALEELARVAERHTGAGLTQEDVAKIGATLDPTRSYMPQSKLELLICYADKFYSKNGDMKEKPIERVEASLSKFGTGALERFRAMHHRFSQKCI